MCRKEGDRKLMGRIFEGIFNLVYLSGRVWGIWIIEGAIDKREREVRVKNRSRKRRVEKMKEENMPSGNINSMAEASHVI